MTYVIKNDCIDVKDQKCQKVCPVDCIYFGERAAYIQPEECIDCGACVDVCPVHAIAYEGDLAPEDRYLIARQRETFQNVGSPGGSRAFGPIPADHPAVATMPRRSREGSS
jgi:NAD-dependent dihydropyrimidine dehydrogenase PreA subunit